MKAWSRALIMALAAASAGCGEGAKLIQEQDHGGVVVYPFKEGQGPLLSSFRKDALTLMGEKCGGPYVIVKEGETKGRQRLAGPEGSQEIVHERRWGIQFQCK